ncbi:MAG: sigma-54-dependent transcriptional regulator [Rhodospirillales bacterium]
MAHGILVIEDEVTLASNIKKYLERHDYEVHIAPSGESGLQQFEAFRPDLVLLDYHLPGIDGVEVLKRIRSVEHGIKAILITAHGNVEVAVEAMKAGAYDYLSKPVVLSELKLLIDKAVGQERLEGTLSYYRRREAGTEGLSAMIGESPPVRTLKQQIEQVIKAGESLAGETPAGVLITGETGTGKELVARALHFEGPRRNAPFVEINCTSIPGHLVEAELFGYERGAFTDAKERKLGLVETADGGTLFLDEIGDVEAAVQAKLLKLLEDRMVRRVGSVRDRRVDVHIVAATNRCLEDLVRGGQFRADLYFRLRVISLNVPALRDRGGDVVLLARQFLSTHGRRYGKDNLRLTPAAERALAAYGWPGNVRELRNVIEQAVLLATGDTIDADQLSLSPALAPGQGPEQGENHASSVLALPPGGVSLEKVERAFVVQALEKSSWNVTRAAKLLGLTRDTLRYRIEKYGLKCDP